MKKIVSLIVPILFLASFGFGQAAWVEPNPANVNAEIKIMIDVSQPDCECPLLLDADSLYLWTWEPTENATINNGQWNASNPELKMTKESDNIWSYTLIPTQFYNVEASEVYDKGISFLAKFIDGSAIDGAEPKSADQHVDIDPLGCVDKVCTFPQFFKDDDYLTIIYDNTLEDKSSMQNLDPDNCYFLPTAVAGGIQYQYTTNNFDPNNLLENSYPELKMTFEGEGKFAYTILSDEFFRSDKSENPVPPNVKIDKITMIFRKSEFNGQFTNISELEFQCED